MPIRPPAGRQREALGAVTSALACSASLLDWQQACETAAPTVKQEHELRTGGPYAITRHPIYSGLLGMFLGSLLLAGAGRWIVAFPVYLVLLQFKIHTEERLMLAEFPGDYPRYRQRAPHLVPGLRLISGHTHASRQTPAGASR